MANVEKISVALTPELAALTREAVERGEYASASEVIREALREWKLRRTERDRALAELGRLWDEGLESGPGTEGAEAFSRIRRNLNLRVAQRPE